MTLYNANGKIFSLTTSIFHKNKPYKIMALKLFRYFSKLPSENQNNEFVGDILKYWREKFENEKIPEPHESADHIMAHVLGTKRIIDLPNFHNKKLNRNELEKIQQLYECRLSRMPIQYIIKEWDFRDLTLMLEPPIFIPRPETEILVDALLKKIAENHCHNSEILEIGCGSGAISLSILSSQPFVKVIAIDTNLHACELTKKNAENLQLSDRLNVSNAILTEEGLIDTKNNLNQEKYQSSENAFDFIISNPPYIPTKKIFKLEPEIYIYEDIKALDGGADGLKIIKPILKYSSKALKKGGSLFLEVDPDHPTRIKHLIEVNYSTQLKFVNTLKDFCNFDRIVEISRIN